MIATNEAADILRRGWEEATSSLGADVPAVAELLRTRLEVGVASGRLDERHLLDTVAEAEALMATSGSTTTEPLALRLRRTVYEYLLALDATRPAEHRSDPVEERRPGSDGALVGAEEIAALGHAAPHAAPAGADAPGAPVEPAAVAADPAPVATAPEAVGNEPGPVADEPAGAAIPTFPGPEALAEQGQRGPYADIPFDAPHDGEAPETPAAADAAVKEPADTPVVDAGAAEEPVTTTAGDSAAGTGFVAPRAGFHIIEDTLPHAPASETPVQMPVFSSDASQPEQATRTEFLSWRSSPPEANPADAAPAAAPPPVAEPPALTAPAPEPAAHEEEEDDDDGQRGWRVRRPGEPASVRGPRGGAAPVEEDPFENNTRLADKRRKIEDRLRRKRCDDAAALLQEIAQETGGRSVAELAMNAGDRCRALGKSNAALNCYLAAARSDPVYELPLSRLADICIDNQDTELAVSYLERIARLYRFRGDERSALRIYRRIATVAPYREDVLAMLLNAQTTGRLE